MSDKTAEILETIDALLEIFEIEECIIAVKDFNKKAVDDIIQYLGTYTNIKVRSVPDLFTMGWERNLIQYFYHQKIKKYPIEKSIVVNNVSTIYSIYEALKYRKPIIDRIVTISGNAVKNPQNVLVKVGTKIKDILKEIGGCNTEDYIIILNGPMMGYQVNEDTVITKGTRGIIIQKKEEPVSALKCMNCGKCTNICPVRLAPALIMKNNNEKIVALLHPEKCVGCGMCSYICPAKIQVRDEIATKKEQLMKVR